MKKIWAFLLLASALSVATSPLSSVTSAVSQLCSGLTSLLPVASMLMVVVAGVIYAAGQLMGAETRARANVWATAALTGALIGVLIYAVAPAVLKTIYAGTGVISCSGVYVFFHFPFFSSLFFFYLLISTLCHILFKPLPPNN